MTSLYTIVAIRRAVDDLKRVLFGIKLSTIILYMIYLVYSIIEANGYIAIKAVLLALSIAYFVFYIILHDRVDKSSKDVKRLSDRLYRVAKIVLNGLTLALTVWSFIIASEAPTTISIFLAVCMAIGWTISILLELTYGFVDSRVELILEGIEMDKEAIMKPVTSVKGVVGRIMGKDAEPTPEPSKTRQRLMKYAEEQRIEADERRRIKKQEKKAKKEAGRKRTRSAKTANTESVTPPRPVLPEPSEASGRKGRKEKRK